MSKALTRDDQIKLLGGIYRQIYDKADIEGALKLYYAALAKATNDPIIARFIKEKVRESLTEVDTDRATAGYFFLDNLEVIEKSGKPMKDVKLTELNETIKKKIRLQKKVRIEKEKIIKEEIEKEKQQKAEEPEKEKEPEKAEPEKVEEQPKLENIDTILQNFLNGEGWANDFRDLDKEKQREFLSALEKDSANKNIIILNAVPKAKQLSKTRLDDIVKILNEARRKNYFQDSPTRITISKEDLYKKGTDKDKRISLVELRSILGKNQKNVKMIDLLGDVDKQTPSQIIKDKNKEQVYKALEAFYPESTIEERLAALSGEQFEPKTPARQRKKFEQLPKAELTQQKSIVDQLKEAENELIKNTLRPKAIEELSKTDIYKTSNKPEREQLIQNKINDFKANDINFIDELNELYAIVGRAFDSRVKTKEETLRILDQRDQELTAFVELAEGSNEFINEQLAKEEYLRDEQALQDAQSNIAEQNAKIKKLEPQFTKALKALKTAKTFSKMEYVSGRAPKERISAEKSKEVEQSVEGTAYQKVLPKYIEKTAKLPNIPELLKSKKQRQAVLKKKDVRTPAEEAELEQIPLEISKLENVKRGMRKIKDVPVSKPSTKQGKIRPFYKNVTEGNLLKYHVLQTEEEFNKVIRNADVFDIPNDNTGVGNSRQNPMVRDNEEHYNRTHEGTLNDIVSWDNYAQSENFWKPEPTVNIKKANEQLFYDNLQNDETRINQLLQKFNKDDNGFIDQYQQAEETNKFKMAYIPPSNYYKPTLFNKFADAQNQTGTHTGFLNNVNYFLNK